MTEEIGSTKPQTNYGTAGAKPVAEAPKTEREPVKRIVTEDVKRKKSLGRKMREQFNGEDAKTVAEYVLTGVILPKIKDMVFDAFTEGMHRTLFGSGRNPTDNRRNGNNTNYNRMYVSPNKGYGSPAPSQQAQQQHMQSRGPNDFLDFIIPSRGQAEEVIDGLIAVLDQYGTVSVHELKEMVGITGEFTDQKWGWKNLSSAGVERDRDGYRLVLPKVISLD